MSRGILSELSNGLKVATRAMPQVQSLSVGIWVKAGARDERDSETGIAHMLEHMAFKGTKSRSARDIATEVENVGGYMNAHTSREETAYYLRLLPEYLDMGIDILADILTEPTMPDEEIERERGVIIQEIGQSLDTPDDIVFDMFAKASYGSHTLGRPILGDAKHWPTDGSWPREETGQGLFLSAVELELPHPATGAALRVKVAPPPKFEKFVAREAERHARLSEVEE